MDFDSHLDSDYLAMTELTEEVGAIVQKSIDNGSEDLSSEDIEYILKMTSQVTKKISSQVLELSL